MARGEEREAGSAGGVVLLVCEMCGREYQYDRGEEAPGDLTCEKCGGTVFRRFDATETPDDVEADFQDSTERDLATDDPAGDATRGDLHDLNNP
jgi:DNA-directed RNA polymerase subunit RPC12/RpoP